MKETSRFNKLDANRFATKFKDLYLKTAEAKPPSKVNVQKILREEKKKAIGFINGTDWMFETKSNPTDFNQRIADIGKVHKRN